MQRGQTRLQMGQTSIGWLKIPWQDKPTSDWVKKKSTCENERAHAWDEARKKAVEREGSDKQTVKELQRSCQQDVQQIRIHQFQLVGSRRGVLL